jgi:hypothetical protein
MAFSTEELERYQRHILLPEVGGAGDFVANVFVLAQTLDPVTESVNGNFSNERIYSVGWRSQFDLKAGIELTYPGIEQQVWSMVKQGKEP